MSVKHFDGGETKTAGTPEAAYVRPSAVTTQLGAVGQTTAVRSGAVGLSLTGSRHLLVNPKWTDTSEDYFDFHILLVPNTFPNDFTTTRDCILFCTTPNPHADGGTWFKVQLRLAKVAGVDKFVAVEVFKGATDGFPDSGAPDGSYGFGGSEQTSIWLVLRCYKGAAGSVAPSIEVFSGDNSRFTVTGTIDGETVNARSAFGMACPDDPKGDPYEPTFHVDDLIYLDEDSSGNFDGRMVEATSSGVIIGYQAVADVTGYNDYVTTNSSGGKKYRCIDDQNRVAGSPNDDWMTPASTWKQLFDIANSGDAGPTVHAIRLDAYPRAVDTTGTQLLAGVSDEGTGPETITGWDDGVSGYVSALLYTTPKDGNAWSKDKLNIFYAGVTRSDAAKTINAFGVQVLGVGLTTPTANPDSDNADVADPWAAAAEEAIPGPPVAAQII